jgi:hypothetical protein
VPGLLLSADLASVANAEMLSVDAQSFRPYACQPRNDLLAGTRGAKINHAIQRRTAGPPVVRAGMPSRLRDGGGLGRLDSDHAHRRRWRRRYGVRKCYW